MKTNQHYIPNKPFANACFSLLTLFSTYTHRNNRDCQYQLQQKAGLANFATWFAADKILPKENRAKIKHFMTLYEVVIYYGLTYWQCLSRFPFFSLAFLSPDKCETPWEAAPAPGLGSGCCCCGAPFSSFRGSNFKQLGADAPSGKGSVRPCCQHKFHIILDH